MKLSPVLGIMENSAVIIVKIKETKSKGKLHRHKESEVCKVFSCAVFVCCRCWHPAASWILAAIKPS